MKKLFRIIAIICTVIIFGLLALAAFSYFTYKAEYKHVETETASLATADVKSVVTSWDSSELQKISHPLLIAELQKPNQDLEGFFKVYRHLGALKAPVLCKLVNFKSNIGIPSYTVADYSCSTSFENGEATIYIELVSDKDSQSKFLVTVFRIESPLFLKILEK